MVKLLGITVPVSIGRLRCEFSFAMGVPLVGSTVDKDGFSSGRLVALLS